MAEINYTEKEVAAMKAQIRTFKDLIAANRGAPGMDDEIARWEQEIRGLEASLRGEN
jgi:hypothetical protein